MKDYKVFFDIDLEKLPTAVLTSISIAVSNELSKRRNVNKEAESYLKHNSRFVRKIRTEFHKNMLGFLRKILDEDWSYLFEGSEEKKFYVYAHVKPNRQRIVLNHEKLSFDMKALPFYIGKGTGDRAYDLKRNEGHGVTLKELKQSGHTKDEIVVILKDNLTEAEALALESQLIFFFGTKFETQKGILVNLDVPKRPGDAEELIKTTLVHKKRLAV
jgi:hypothetical protein